jgi:hypothetical protein
MTQMQEYNLVGQQHFPRRRQHAIQNFNFFPLQSKKRKVFPVYVMKTRGGTINTFSLNIGAKWK